MTVGLFLRRSVGRSWGPDADENLRAGLERPELGGRGQGRGVLAGVEPGSGDSSRGWSDGVAGGLTASTKMMVIATTSETALAAGSAMKRYRTPSVRMLWSG